MIRILLTPQRGENIYSLLVRKEVQLRKRNQGTLHRSAAKRKGQEKWAHASYKGWVTFQQSLGGVCVAAVQSRDSDAE